MSRGRFVSSVVCLFALASAPARAKVTIEFDYSLDINKFFDLGSPTGQAARAELQAAAHVFEDRILESNLPAITPPVTRSWTANFTSPGSGTAVSLQDVSI